MAKKIRTPFAATLQILLIALSLFACTPLCHQLFMYGRVLNGQTVFSLLLELALCVILFAKKRNIALLAVLGVQTVLRLSSLTGYFSIFSLLHFAALALVFVFALACCEVSFIQADFSRIKALADKLFFLPAALSLIATLYYQFTITADLGVPFRMMIFAEDLLGSFMMLALGMWLKDPYAKEKPADAADGSFTAEECGEAYCSLGKHILLCLFTFGIWYLIWTYRTTKFLNKTPDAAYYNPTSKLLLCMFVPFYQIYWFYKHGQRIDAFSKQKKLTHSDMATLCLILGIFIPIVACILMQDRINALCTVKEGGEEVPAADAKETVTADAERPVTVQLKEYKDLLDSGVITQEEFDAKKKQLLGI